MTSADVLLLVVAAGLVLLAGLLTSVEAAISSMSKARATELAASGRAGAPRLLTIVSDPARFVNTALLAGVACETTAIVIVTKVIVDLVSPTFGQILIASMLMVMVSYIAVGVGPRTVGRQHSERVALMSAGPVAALTVVLGPLAQGLIMIGNAATPGRGFREGPFASEAELRELVDQAEQSAVIESAESRMIHSVFELGDTLVREVMVPRTDMVFIERHKTLRQFLSLALRSGYSRIPVIGDDLDDVIGMAYLKDVTKRIFDNRDAETSERIETVMRDAFFVPDSLPADELMRDMQARRMHVAIVVDEYGGTAGLVTIEDLLEEIVGEITDEYDVDPDEIEHLPTGGFRVSSRLPVDDLGELFRIELDDEDVETVGGLMAKHLGRVPIPGAEVEFRGLRFRAESPAGRRNKVVTIAVTPEGRSGDDDDPSQGAIAPAYPPTRIGTRVAEGMPSEPEERVGDPVAFRSGFASIVGRPNAGKSTLTNALVGKKIAITSAKPQTTRHAIRGIVHRPDAQLVLVDTPGLHKPRTLLGERLNDLVRGTWSEVDLIIVCLPATDPIGPGDRFLVGEVAKVTRTPKLAVATKTDLVAPERLIEHLSEVQALGDGSGFEWAEIVPVSAVTGDQVALLRDLLLARLPEGPPLYPDGELTDEPELILVAELIREAALEGVRDELPHSLAVVVEEMVPRADRPPDRPLIDVRADLYCERNSQKGIVIGHRGERLRRVGTQARTQIEALLGTPIYLDLHVKVAKDWQRDPKQLRRLGF